MHQLSQIHRRSRLMIPDAEVKRLLKHVEADRLAHAWHLALSGLRRGELCGLRWSDVDLKDGTLTVAHNRCR
jgi:integrase